MHLRKRCTKGFRRWNAAGPAQRASPTQRPALPNKLLGTLGEVIIFQLKFHH